MSGLPRSGSSLICNVLNSNPNFHSTPTSGILDCLNNIKSTFSHNPNFKNQDRLELMGDISNSMKGFLEGYFESKPGVVFDKSRGWPNHIQMIDAILGHKETKLIWTYRNPVEVINSIEKQYQKTILLENADEISDGIAFKTLDRRIASYYNILDGPVETLIDAIEMGYGDRIMVVPYSEFCNNPQMMLNQIHIFIGEGLYKYNLDDIKQSTYEWDGTYNYKFLHTIKEGKVELSQSNIILLEKYINLINERYSKLNELLVK